MTEHTAEIVALTEDERSELACFCHSGICPIHNEESDGYVEHPADVLFGLVERVVALRMAQAWDEGHRGLCRRHGIASFEACRNPYRPIPPGSGNPE